jgi:hypothetical protein
MGSWGNTSSTSKAALSAIRRAPQLGQNPRRLQLKYDMALSYFKMLARHREMYFLIL